MTIPGIKISPGPSKMADSGKAKPKSTIQGSSSGTERVKTFQKSHDMELLARRAEIFRSKLIEDFHLLATISEKGKVEIPKYYTKDVSDKSKMTHMMTHNPHGLVRFQVYAPGQDNSPTGGTEADRRKNRILNKMSKNPPLEMWAHWVVESSLFQNSILTLILFNCVVLGIQSEYGDNDDPKYDTMKYILDIFDYCTLFVFALEIFLKWTDNFITFWKNGWNIFDFFVTFFSFVPEVINFSSGPAGNTAATSSLRVIAENLRVFRVLRSLKMVTRFKQVRLIALAVGKAFQAMLFITLLFFTFAYIFAIAGVIFFDNYQHTDKILKYQNSFASIDNALVTLFQLFTLDHWLDIYKDVTMISNSWFSGLYIILWIFIGSFVFRNIFVGIMVNNFQSIRNELFQEVKEYKDKEKRENQMAEFAEELTKQQASHQKMNSEIKNEAELKEAISEHVIKETHSSTEWQKLVEKNLVNLAKEEATFCWPRDSLFHYFLMMEALCENLSERHELVNLATECLLNISDC